MLEMRSRIFRSNGDRVYFSRSVSGEYRWVDAVTNLAVPDNKAYMFDFLYGHEIESHKGRIEW